MGWLSVIVTRDGTWFDWNILLVPHQPFNIAPHLNQQYKFTNVDFRYTPVLVSWTPVPGSKDLPSEPVSPGAFSISLDPAIVSTGLPASADAPPPPYDHRYHLPLVLDPTDKDFGPKAVYNGTETDDMRLSSTTQEYHEYLLHTNDFPH